MTEAGARGVGRDGVPHTVAGSGRQTSLRFGGPVLRGVVGVLTADQCTVASVVGGLRQAENLGAGRQDAHGATRTNVSDADGAAGELFVSLDLNLAWTGVLTRRTTLPDVGRRIEVRTTRWPHGHLIVQHDDAADALCVLVIVALPRMRAVGWMRAGDAKQPCWRRTNRDGRPVWYVPQSALHDYDRVLLRRLDEAP